MWTSMQLILGKSEAPCTALLLKERTLYGKEVEDLEDATRSPPLIFQKD